MVRPLYALQDLHSEVENFDEIESKIEKFTVLLSLPFGLSHRVIMGVKLAFQLAENAGRYDRLM